MGAGAVLLLLAACESGAAPALADPPAAPTPRWIAQRFLDPGGFAEREEHYTGEMWEHYRTERTLGEYFPDVRREFLAIAAGDSTAVEAVAMRDSGGPGKDYYLHFARVDGAWKLAAVRALWIPAWLGILADSIAAMPSPPDSMQWLLENFRLLSANDDSLLAFATGRRPALDSLVTAFRASRARAVSGTYPRGAGARTRSVRALRARLRALRLESIESDSDHPGLVFLWIGGILDNAAGFVWVPPGHSPPRMRPDRWILVRPAGGGWYLCKTT